MSDLAEFLRARLDEDEVVAGAARNWTDRDWTTSLDERGDGWVSADGADPIVVTIGHSDTQASAIVEHIARWDPARVLAEVAVKRRLARPHGPGRMGEDIDGDPARFCRGHDAPTLYPCSTLLTLVQPYAYRPDFDPAWRLA